MTAIFRDHAVMLGCVVMVGCSTTPPRFQQRMDAARQRAQEDSALSICWKGKLKSYQRNRNYKKGVKNYEKAVSQSGNTNVKLYVELGNCHRDNGVCRRALESYRRAVTLDANSVEGRIGELQCHREESRPDLDRMASLLAEIERLAPGRTDVAEIRREVQSKRAAQDRRKRDREEIAKREQAQEQRRLQDRAKLQSQVSTGKVQCRVIDTNIIGKDFGNEYTTRTASGVYFGLLVKCTNTGRRTTTLSSRVWTLVDGAGRQYDIDVEGSVQFLLWKDDDSQKNPEFVALHPGVLTMIALIFDVPEAMTRDPVLQLDFQGARFRLVF